MSGIGVARSWARRRELVTRTIGLFAVLLGSAVAGWWWVRQCTREYNARLFGNVRRGTVIFSNTLTDAEPELTRTEG
jgi:hypothetical protein